MATTVIESVYERRSPVTNQLTMAMFGRRISWPAIFGGVVATMFVQILISALGAGVGVNLARTANTSNTGLGIGAIAWVFASTVVGLFVGGWVAGRLSGIPRKGEAALHGFLTASAGTCVTLLILSTAMAGIFGATGDFAWRGQAISTAAAQQAAFGAVLSAYGGFLLLLLGSVAAILGGYMSVPPVRVVRP